MITVSTYAQQMPDLVKLVNLDSLVKTVREFSGEDSVFVDTGKVRIKHRVSRNGNNLAAAYLVQKLKNLGLTVMEHNYRVGGKNIVAINPGKVNPDSLYLMGAHYDAVADYCADDNASGSASVLEAARIMSNYCFENTVVYAFWDEEERGLVGSRFYADSVALKGHKFLGVLNNDMLGYDSDSNHVFDIHTNNTPHNQKMKDTLLYVIDTLKLNLVPQVINPGTTRSDHASFWRKGYPAVFFGESFLGGDPNPQYHKSTDRINLFNLPYFHELVKLGVGTIVQLAGIIPTAIKKDTQVACELYVYRDSTFTSSTIYHDSLRTVNDCDSIYSLYLTINYNQYHSDTISACNTFSYRGKDFTQSGIYHDTLNAQNGCDSFYSLDLTILESQMKTDTIVACDIYVYRSMVYDSSGIYSDTLQAKNGCDSFYRIDLTIIKSSFKRDTITACDLFNYRKTSFTRSGIYYDTLMAHNGCDSIYSFDLTIINSVENHDTVTACNSYTSNGQTHNSTGTFRYKYTAANSCDSTYILHLTVIHLNDPIVQNDRVLSAYDSTAKYQWLSCPGYTAIMGDTNQNYKVIKDGTYAVQVSKGMCVDTSECIEMLISNSANIAFAGVNIYPNPSEGLVNIEFQSEQKGITVSIFSVQGKLMYQKETINQKSIQLNLNVSKGLYLIKLDNKNEWMLKKIYIQ